MVGLSLRDGPSFRTGVILVGVENIFLVQDHAREIKRLIGIEQMTQPSDEK